VNLGDNGSTFADGGSDPLGLEQRLLRNSPLAHHHVALHPRTTDQDVTPAATTTFPTQSALSGQLPIALPR
jgi:hypothetical protein